MSRDLKDDVPLGGHVVGSRTHHPHVPLSEPSKFIPWYNSSHNIIHSVKEFPHALSKLICDKICHLLQAVVSASGTLLRTLYYVLIRIQVGIGWKTSNRKMQGVATWNAGEL